MEPHERYFDSRISIRGQVKVPLTSIRLDADGLEVSEAVAINPSGTAKLDVVALPGHGGILLRSRSALSEGTWTLQLKYRGTVHSSNHATVDGITPEVAHGVFIRRVSGETFYYTHSEPEFAREIFPCIDRPSVKARWRVNLIIANGTVAASNSPVMHAHPVDALRTSVQFEWTPVLPAYTIAFATGPFVRISLGATSSGMSLSIFAPAGDVPLIDRRIGETLAKSVELLGEWTGLVLPSSKLDFVVTSNTGWRAMENYGLVSVDREAVNDLSVLRHEIVHQWFGNIITPADWRDVWLSESFAEWLQRDLSRLQEQSPVIGTSADELKLRLIAQLQSGAHVRSQDPAVVRFSTVIRPEAFSLGADILEMLEMYFGHDAVFSAVRDYVAKYRFGSASTQNLLTVFQRVLGNEAPELVDALDSGDNTLSFSASCSLNGSAIQVKRGKHLKVCIAYDFGGQRRSSCIAPHEDQVVLSKCPLWVLPNEKINGPYRVSITHEQLGRIIKDGWDMLSPAEKMMLFFQGDQEQQLMVYSRAVIRDELPLPLAARVEFLLRTARYVPEDAWGPFCGLIGDYAGHWDSETDPLVRTKMVELLIVTGNLQRAMDIIRQLEREGVDSDDLKSLRMLSELRNGTTTLGSLLEKATQSQDQSLRSQARMALMKGRDIGDFVVEKFAQLNKMEHWEMVQLLSQLCSLKTRDAIGRINASVPNARLDYVLGSVNECLRTKAQWSTYFAAWPR